MKQTITNFSIKAMLLCLLAFTGTTQLNAKSIVNVYIPDANFKAYILNNLFIDANSDGEIQFSEAAGFTGAIDISLYFPVSDLTGIEAFTSLTYLDCSYKTLTSLDLSQNTALTTLGCSSNNLSSLDLSQNTALSTLYCDGNPFSSLDLSHNTALVALICNNCYNLSSLDLSHNNVLTTFSCNGCNALTGLNIKNGNNANMSTMNAGNTFLLTCIQVDNVANANSYGWQIDFWKVSFSTNCSNTCVTTNSSYTVSACGSYTWAAKGNKVYTASNNTDTIVLINAAGCDSVITLNLTINTATTSTTTQSACGSYTWNGVNYTSSGTYTKTFTGGNSKGCDSVATLNLTVSTAPNISYTGVNSIYINGTAISALNPVNVGGTSTTSIITIASGFNALRGIALDAAGVVYVCDAGNNLLKKIATNGTVTTVASGFAGLNGVAVDAAGVIYVADLFHNVVKKIATNGTITTIGSGFNLPAGVAVDASGQVFVADLGSNTVKKIATNGTVTTLATGLNQPRGVAVDAAGVVYVTDFGNNAVKKIATNGTVTTIGSGFNLPFGVIVDATGVVYISDYGNNAVKKIATNGTVTTIGSGFNQPLGIALDAAGSVYVGDGGSDVVKKILFSNYTISPALPAGLSLNAATGAITGTPTITTATTTYTIATQNNCGNNSTSISFKTCSPSTATFTVTACNSYTWVAKGNKIYTASNTTDTIHLTNKGGCDSLVTLNLTLNNATASSSTVSICPSALPYSWNGLTFNTAGTQVAHFTNSVGCDSAATLNLTVKATSSSINTASVCSNQLPYVWNGLTFTAASTQTKTGLVNAAGCDSSATLTLSVATSSAPTVSITTASNNVCAGTSVTFNATSSNGGTSPIYDWKKNGVSAGSGSTITFLGGSLADKESVWCELTSNSACATSTTATSSKIIMTIKSVPVIGSSSLSKSVLCSIGATTTANNTNTIGGGVWTSSDANIATASNNASGASSVITAGSTNGTATLTYTKTSINGCSASAGILITVATIATPVLSNVPTTICKGATVTLGSNTAGGTWLSYTNAGTVNAATGLFTAINANIANVRYTITNASACSSFATAIFIVVSAPTIPNIAYASGTVNPQYGPGGAYCNGKTFTLKGTPTGGVWSAAGGITVDATTGVASTITNGAAIVTYTVSSAAASCSNSRSITGTVATCAFRGTNSTSSIVNSPSSMTTDFVIYPNPARTSVSLYVETLIGTGNITITNLYGKQVKAQPLSMGTNTINVSTLAKGMYFISTITNEGKTTKKLVVE